MRGPIATGIAAACVITLAVLAARTALPAGAGAGPVVLPNGWLLEPPRGAEAATGTMPQGMALSPDAATIAVVESGYNPPALSLHRLADLATVATIPLPGALGRPVWRDASHVLVAGANADALFDVDVDAKSVRRIAFPAGSYPAYVAVSPDGQRVAVASDADGAVRIGTLESIGAARAIGIGGHPGDVAFTGNGTVVASLRSGSALVAIDAATGAVTRHPSGFHPSAMALAADKLYVAETDADALGIYDAGDLHLLQRVGLGDASVSPPVTGVSPNGVCVDGDTVYVTLGAANSVAIVRNGRLNGRIQAGWYPTGAFAAGGRLYVLDGKGEGAHPNPQYRPGHGHGSYVAALEAGSIRAYDLATAGRDGTPQGALGWNASRPASAIVRPDGPIRHVFLVIKENRSYDQVLGDVPEGSGDASLTAFGRTVTPNDHALAERFGLFDNAYASGEVSSPGHMWDDAAFANDYMERLWPASYAGRRDAVDDLNGGTGPHVPSAGFLWDAAARAHVTFRDYGELVDPGKTPSSPGTADAPSLRGRFDPHYVGWNLDYGDLDRVKEWRREFASFVQSNRVPQFELIWLPNDHTYGSRPGKLTPAAYVATNDYALGQMVDTLSHSKLWASSAMFVIEDDAQDGPDHLSDQRTTMYVISPYARGGVRHEHYSTLSILRTIEIVLGLRPLSTYDAMAVPLSAAFGPEAHLRPYSAIAPKIDVSQRNLKTAYGAAISERLDFSRPDAAPPGVLGDIIARNAGYR